MAGPTFQITQLVGTDSESIEAAIRSGIQSANESARDVDWFKVAEIRGYVKDGEIVQYQVTLEIGSKISPS